MLAFDKSNVYNRNMGKKCFFSGGYHYGVDYLSGMWQKVFRQSHKLSGVRFAHKVRSGRAEVGVGRDYRNH